MDKLGEMLIFSEVVRQGSFSAAARRLDLSPSAVSKQIGRLEDRLGARLFNRTTRKLGLTEGGESFYARCQNILEQIDEAESAVAEMGGLPQGTLRVSSTAGFGKLQIVPLIPEFLDRYPNIRVELDITDRAVDIVEVSIDVAIRLGELSDSSLVARKLGESRRIICASPAYLDRLGVPRTPEDLAHHNCLTLSNNTRFNEWSFDTEEGQRMVRVSGNFETNLSDSLLQAALAGTGIARLSAFMVGPYIKAGQLVPLLDDCNREMQIVHAVYPHRRHLPPKTRAFVDFLAEKFAPDDPPWQP